MKRTLLFIGACVMLLGLWLWRDTAQSGNQQAAPVANSAANITDPELQRKFERFMEDGEGSAG